jgi:hypothetical protein
MRTSRIPKGAEVVRTYAQYEEHVEASGTIVFHQQLAPSRFQTNQWLPRQRPQFRPEKKSWPRREIRGKAKETEKDTIQICLEPPKKRSRKYGRKADPMAERYCSNLRLTQRVKLKIAPRTLVGDVPIIAATSTYLGPPDSTQTRIASTVR